MPIIILTCTDSERDNIIDHLYGEAEYAAANDNFNAENDYLRLANTASANPETTKKHLATLLHYAEETLPFTWPGIGLRDAIKWLKDIRAEEETMG